MIEEKPRSPLNNLTASTWLPLTTSVFSVSNHEPNWDSKASHPATYPIALAERFIRFLSKPGDTVLDPFMGSGSTMIAGGINGRDVIGIELYEKWIKLAWKLIRARGAEKPKQKGLAVWTDDLDERVVEWPGIRILNCDAIEGVELLEENSVDLVVTSPPYADVLLGAASSSALTRHQAREKKGLALNYGDSERDIGRLEIEHWRAYMKGLGGELGRVVKPGGFMVMVVQNIVTKERLIPLAWHLGQDIADPWNLVMDQIWWQKHKAARIAGWPSRPMLSNHHSYSLVWRKDETNTD